MMQTTETSLPSVQLQVSAIALEAPSIISRRAFPGDLGSMIEHTGDDQGYRHLRPELA